MMQGSRPIEVTSSQRRWGLALFCCASSEREYGALTQA
jgi:hypothetical protein